MTIHTLIRSELSPYHVSSRTMFKSYFPIPLNEVWKIMINELAVVHKENGLAIHGFVLMSNHFHLLCHTPLSNLDIIMQRFLRNTSTKITQRTRNSQLWDGPYKWCIIESLPYYFQVYRYIFQNPVRAGICKRVEDYPYSTLKEARFPLHSSVPMMFAGHEGELLWLNEIFGKEDEEVLKLGLKKYQFDVSQRNLKLFSRLSLPD